VIAALVRYSVMVATVSPLAYWSTVALAGVGIYFVFLFATESSFRHVVKMVLKPLTGSRAT